MGNYDRVTRHGIDVAYGCGFTKLSRFSADYAKRLVSCRRRPYGRSAATAAANWPQPQCLPLIGR